MVERKECQRGGGVNNEDGDADASWQGRRMDGEREGMDEWRERCRLCRGEGEIEREGVPGS